MLDRAELVLAGTGNAPWYWDHAGWTMGLHGFFWLLLLGLIAVVVVIATRSGLRSGSFSGTDSALAILGARYARGEIDRGEYLERKKDLS